MSMNGKSTSPIPDLQRRVAVATAALRDLDNKIRNLQESLARAEITIANLKTERNQAECDFVEDKPGASDNLRSVTEHETEVNARIRGLSAKLLMLENQRPALDSEVQRWSVALAEVTAQAEFERLEEELSQARYRLAQSQEQTVQRQKTVNELSDRLRDLSIRRRDNEWRRQRAAATAHHLQNNPAEPGYQWQTRNGF
jgi:chromosome segregation ATPase